MPSLDNKIVVKNPSVMILERAMQGNPQSYKKLRNSKGITKAMQGGKSVPANASRMQSRFAK